MSSQTHGTDVCDRCKGLDLPLWPPVTSLSDVFKTTPLCPLVNDQSCSLCRILEKLSATPRNEEKFYIYPFRTSRSHASRTIVEKLVNRAEDTVSFAVIRECDVYPSEDIDHETWDSVILKTRAWLTPVTENTDSSFSGRNLKLQVDVSLIKSWLKFCADSHPKDSCGAFPGRKCSGVKIINCAERKLEAYKPGNEYLALSYVWGDISSSAKDRTHDTLPKELPNTIEDAISLTLQLGFRYLWIDRYCIPQHSCKERDSQIAQMDLIYSNAHLTLVAAAGSDPTFGLPGVSSKPRLVQHEVTLKDVKYVFIPPDPHIHRPDLVWYNRGWTYQEAILSRRRLHFFEDQLYFTCGGMYCRDVLASPLSAWNFKNKGKLRATPWYQQKLELVGFDVGVGKILTPNTKVPNPMHETFIHISEYSSRSLTNSEDSLNGILGVFQRLKALFPLFRHFFGLPIVVDPILMKKNYNFKRGQDNPDPSWTERLLTALTWYHVGPRSRRPGFPSWSWIGWEGSVRPPGRFGGYIQNTHECRVKLRVTDGFEVVWETFCSTDQFNEETLPVSSTLQVEALQCQLKVWKSGNATTEPSHVLGTDRWWADLKLTTDFSSPVHCHFTPFAAEEQQDVHENRYYTCSGIVLGTRCATFSGKTTSKSTARQDKIHKGERPDPPRVLVILLIHKQNDTFQRRGIAEFPIEDIDEDILITERQAISLE